MSVARRLRHRLPRRFVTSEKRRVSRAAGQPLVRFPRQMVDRAGAWSDFRLVPALVRAIESWAPNECRRPYERVGEAIGHPRDNVSGQGGTLNGHPWSSALLARAGESRRGDIEKVSGLIRAYISRVENRHTLSSLVMSEKFVDALEVSMCHRPTMVRYRRS